MLPIGNHDLDVALNASVSAFRGFSIRALMPRGSMLHISNHCVSVTSRALVLFGLVWTVLHVYVVHGIKPNRHIVGSIVSVRNFLSQTNNLFSYRSRHPTRNLEVLNAHCGSHTLRLFCLTSEAINVQLMLSIRVDSCSTTDKTSGQGPRGRLCLLSRCLKIILREVR